MKITEDMLTEAEYKWAQENVNYYKPVLLAGVECFMLLLKNGNITVGKSVQQAVRMEMNKTGEVIELDGFETDELNSLLWDE